MYYKRGLINANIKIQIVTFFILWNTKGEFDETLFQKVTSTYYKT